MDYSPTSFILPRKPWLDRLQALLEILLASGLVSNFLISLLFILLFGIKTDLLTSNAKIISAFLLMESTLTFLILFAILSYRRETLAGLGLRRIYWKSNFFLGLILSFVLLLVTVFVSFIFKNFFPAYFLQKNPLTDSIKSPAELILFIIAALIAGGLKEEIQRAFIIRRFSRYLGGAGVGLLVWSLVFGAGHYVQGVQGIVTTTILGFIFGVLYLIRGSLIGPVVAHAAYNTLVLIIFWFSSGRFS